MVWYRIGVAWRYVRGRMNHGDVSQIIFDLVTTEGVFDEERIWCHLAEHCRQVKAQAALQNKLRQLELECTMVEPTKYYRRPTAI